VERYASMSGQDALDLFTAHLDPTFREAFEQVRRQRAAEGSVMTWEQAKTEFLALTGEVYERTAEQMLWSFVTGQVKQSATQTIAQYRTRFDINVRIAECITPRLAAAYYVYGLRPDLRARCMGDASGRPFTTVDAAHTYALKEERKMEQERQVGSKANASTSVAVVQEMHPRKKSKSNNGKAANHHSSGAGGAQAHAGRDTNGRGRGHGHHGGRGNGARTSGPSTDSGAGPSQPRVRIANWNLRCSLCKGRGHDETKCPSQRE
jgi:hypothetical protein